MKICSQSVLFDPLNFSDPVIKVMSSVLLILVGWVSWCLNVQIAYRDCINISLFSLPETHPTTNT